MEYKVILMGCDFSALTVPEATEHCNTRINLSELADKISKVAVHPKQLGNAADSMVTLTCVDLPTVEQLLDPKENSLLLWIETAPQRVGSSAAPARILGRPFTMPWSGAIIDTHGSDIAAAMVIATCDSMVGATIGMVNYFLSFVGQLASHSLDPSTQRLPGALQWAVLNVGKGVVLSADGAGITQRKNLASNKVQLRLISRAAAEQLQESSSEGMPAGTYRLTGTAATEPLLMRGAHLTISFTAVEDSKGKFPVLVSARAVVASARLAIPGDDRGIFNAPGTTKKQRDSSTWTQLLREERLATLIASLRGFEAENGRRVQSGREVLQPHQYAAATAEDVVTPPPGGRRGGYGHFTVAIQFATLEGAIAFLMEGKGFTSVGHSVLPLLPEPQQPLQRQLQDHRAALVREAAEAAAQAAEGRAMGARLKA
ncbi:hypothetical protein JZU48_01880, partial [bacterium]|nr:hypothetical protein [bacterium]